MDISKKLRELRAVKGLTQYQLADAAGVVRANYQKWDAGVCQPNYDDLVKLAKFFDVSTDYLLGLKDY